MEHNNPNEQCWNSLHMLPMPILLRSAQVYGDCIVHICAIQKIKKTSTAAANAVLICSSCLLSFSPELMRLSKPVSIVISQPLSRLMPRTGFLETPHRCASVPPPHGTWSRIRIIHRDAVLHVLAVKWSGLDRVGGLFGIMVCALIMVCSQVINLVSVYNVGSTGMGFSRHSLFYYI